MLNSNPSNDEHQLPSDDQTGTSEGGSFLDHLEDLRWVLVKSILGLLIGVAISAFFIDFIMDDILLRPLKSIEPPVVLQNLKPFGQIILYLQVALISGLIITVPWLLYQVWQFIYPALYSKEVNYIRSIVFFSSFCFLLGVSFAYFLVIPYSLQFFMGFGSASIVNNIAADEYMSFIVQIILAAGILFELPMVSYFLSKLGLLTPPFMRHYRRITYFVMVVIAGIITPPDVVSQILLGIPMIILYEISIFISARVLKNKEAAARKETV